ncbi:class I SAM-dependent methyltransferase [Solwaraspora sp. WMMD1047]|uniref:class I SAM-dependent methyltransferase n=1 Tax=Solwaraspora sp. WMMD1047 TaxID=3016102 RepID=UPI0024181105|nr:class I SAM-dependent methyltransferase [Solwaraspora sp. WMMD1047]MDG4834612.1 class I SAM-dependent methyltransferase [Solwaraspora sp. WMMD1047]
MTTIVSRVVADQPAFHSGGERAWSALPATLGLLASLVRPGMATIETGAGSSTVTFAAAGAEHTAISPSADEHDRIRSYCAARDVATDRVTLLAEPSEQALPRLWAAGNRVDIAFIDGKHSFPGPAVDYAYLSMMLRVGGVLVLDDAPIPAVAVVHRHLHRSPRWRRIAVADDRAVAYQKLADEPAGDDWRAQPYNVGFPDFRLLARPPRRWVLAWGIRARRLRGRLARRFPALVAVRRRLLG